MEILSLVSHTRFIALHKHGVLQAQDQARVGTTITQQGPQDPG